MNHMTRCLVTLPCHVNGISQYASLIRILKTVFPGSHYRTVTDISVSLPFMNIATWRRNSLGSRVIVSVCSSLISEMVVMIVLSVIMLDGDCVGWMQCFGRRKPENCREVLDSLKA